MKQRYISAAASPIPLSDQVTVTSSREATPSSVSATPVTPESGPVGPQGKRPLTEIFEETEEPEHYLLGLEEPSSFATTEKEKCWQLAMSQEMKSIESNETWKLTDLPRGQKAIGLKWVYKLKKDATGKVVKHKARLVAKGYVQRQGIDYDEVFAPVARIESVRLLIALAAQGGKFTIWM